MKKLLLLIIGFCSLLNGCALTGKTTEKDPALAAAVVRLYEIGQRELATGLRGAPSLDNTQDEVVAALKLAGGDLDYLDIGDFVAVLEKYEAQFGRDKFFLGAARLAHSYSDGEFGGALDKSYPDLRDRFLKEMESP